MWWALAVLLVAAIVIGALLLVRHSNDEWQRLRDAARSFESPDSWDLVGAVEQGSYVCVVSCDNPRVTLVYRTDSSPGEACVQAEAALDGLGRETEQSGYAGCGPARRLPDVGGRAFVIARAADLGELQGVELEDAKGWPRWDLGPVSGGTGTVVWVEVSSGID